MASKQKIKLADLMKKQIVNFINAIVYSLLLSYLISAMLPELISFTMLAQIIILPVWLGVVFFQSSEKINYGTDKKSKKLLHQARQTPVMAPGSLNIGQNIGYAIQNKRENLKNEGGSPNLVR